MDICQVAEFIGKISRTKYGINKEGFREFEAKDIASVAAVDGSSIKILDGGNFFIYGVRAGYIRIENGKIEKFRGKISIEIVEDESQIDEIRKKMEMDFVEKVNAEIVLVDGILDKKMDNAVGISKKSGLKMGNFPLLYIIKREGDKILPEKRWIYEIDDGIYAVKFHPHSRFAFRVDCYGNVMEKVAKISSLCNEVGIIGYPYPLAMAHRMVEIKKEEADYIKRRIKEEARMKDEEWENIFYDYHEYMVG